MNCCGNSNQQEQSRESMAVCPVMGNPIAKEVAEDKGMVREYEGKKYYFCCEGCPEKFEKNPGKYKEVASDSSEENRHHKGGCC